jgi:uncharacterized protein YqjF (DUF2071 family)
MVAMAHDGDPKPFLTAQWRDLALLNYRVDPSLLLPYLPWGVELDLWEDRAYVSLVGFRFLDTRIWGAPIPFHRNFEEANLRFYVRRGERRGVTFIREIVPRRAIAFLARTLYGENYIALPMRHSVDDDSAFYGWQRRAAWSAIRMSLRGEPRPLRPASHEEFIAEHYWGYTRAASHTVEYRVQHPAWHVRDAESASVEGELGEPYPEAFAFLRRRAPDSAFAACGSAVTVFRGKKLTLPGRREI